MKMIDKNEYDKLYSKMEKHHAVYQKWTRLEKRMPFFLKFIDEFKDKKVLELGCNAGLYGYHIAQTAKSYIGADQGDCYIAQANETKKFIKNPNVQFVQAKVKNLTKDIDKYTFDTLFCSFALYHFSNKGVARTKEYILPKCNTVVISTRTQKRKKWNSDNDYKFYKPKNVERWLRDSGFEVESHPCPLREGDKVPHFVITIGKRPGIKTIIIDEPTVSDKAMRVLDERLKKEAVLDDPMPNVAKALYGETPGAVVPPKKKVATRRRRNYTKKESGNSKDIDGVGQSTQEK